MTNLIDFFTELFGEEVAKSDRGLELISATVMQYLNESANVSHNPSGKSTVSGRIYRIDCLIEDYRKSKVIEAKDHRGNEVKVSGPEVSKLFGVIRFIDKTDESVNVSATDNSGPEIANSKKTKQDSGIPLELYVIHPEKVKDLEGKPTSIILNLTVHFPNFHKAVLIPKFKPEARKIFENIGLSRDDHINLRMDGFYTKSGSLISSISDLTRKLECDSNSMSSKGNWEFEDMHIYINDSLVPISYCNYEIPFAKHIRKISVGESPVVFVISNDGMVNTLISFKELKSAYNKVVKRGNFQGKT